jgi:protein gp37
MGDVGSTGVKDEWLCALWAVMALTPQHTYLILTKRPGRLASWLRDPRTYPGVLDAADPIRRRHDGMQLTLIGISNPATVPLCNVWIGTSFGNQEEYDARRPELDQVPAAHRWLSYEPATGPVDLGVLRCCDDDPMPISWVVVGAESGPKRRPFDQAWARNARDACTKASVPFYLKQVSGCGHEECHCREDDGECTRPADHPCEDNYEQSKVFKHPLLDGVQHLATPFGED